MKKVGILTFHFADNYGAVLQAYALRRAINKLPNCEAEIINYVPKEFRYQKTWIDEYEKLLFEQKRELFSLFLKEHCGVSKEEVDSLNKTPEYDIYVVGSDQIWCTGRIYDDYFLPWIPKGAKRISYAASIGVEVTSPSFRVKVLEQNLSQFEHLSVREYEHVEFIEQLSGKSCKCVLDPTFLLDVSEYDELIAKEVLSKEKFLFFFWLSHDKEYMRGVEFVNNMARKTGYKIIHYFNFAPDYMFVNDGGSMQFEGIENFLWYIKNAECVITNSYHGTIFSILFHVPFYTFIAQKMRARIDTLCKRFGIEDRVIERYLPVQNISQNVDFVSLCGKINSQRKEAFEYLEKALSD